MLQALAPLEPFRDRAAPRQESSAPPPPLPPAPQRSLQPPKAQPCCRPARLHPGLDLAPLPFLSSPFLFPTTSPALPGTVSGAPEFRWLAWQQRGGMCPRGRYRTKPETSKKEQKGGEKSNFGSKARLFPAARGAGTQQAVNNPASPQATRGISSRRSIKQGQILGAIWQDGHSPASREPQIHSSDSQVRVHTVCLSLANP